MSRLLRSLDKARTADELDKAVRKLPYEQARKLSSDLADRVAKGEKLSHREWEIYERLEDRFLD